VVHNSKLQATNTPYIPPLVSAVWWCLMWLDGAGGRVTGKEVIAELVVELRASVEAAEQFEGEMRNLAAYAKALAQALDCIRSAGGNRSVTLLQFLQGG